VVQCACDRRLYRLERRRAGRGSRHQAAGLGPDPPSEAEDPRARPSEERRDGGVLDRKFTVDPASRQVRPFEVGDDILRIAAQPSQFGGREVHQDLPIKTKPIIVNVLPDDFTVETPGETIQLTATSDNAKIETLSWESAQGSWEDGLGGETDGGATRPLKTPTSASAYPFFVTVESTSDQGLRASGEPRRLDIATIRYQTTVLVSPSGICVPNGDNETSSAEIVGSPGAAFTWTLVDVGGGPASGAGTILETTGRYVSPPSAVGEVHVVATSVGNANAKGKALVLYGPCVCYWTLEIEADRSFAGDFISHQISTDTAPAFTLTITHSDAQEIGSGFAQVAGGPGGGELGSWPAIFVFSDGQRAWSAGNTGEEASAFLTVTFNSTGKIEGFVSGVAATLIGEEVFYRPFELIFRSEEVNFEQSICGQ